MCPATLAIVSVAASAAGSVYGGIASAQSAAYQAQVARNNANIEAKNAAYAAAATGANVEKAGLEARAKLANVRAAAAAGNIDVNTGSPAQVQISQRELGGLDTATVAAKGAREVYGYQSQGVGYEAEAALKQSEVVPDIVGGVLGGIGKVAGGMSNLPSPGSGAPGGPSMIESASSVPSDYQWMTTSGGGDTAFAF